MTVDHVLDLIFFWLGVVFKQRYVAPLVIFPVLVTTAICLWANAFLRARVWLRAANNRIAVLNEVLGDESDPAADRAAFANGYTKVVQVFRGTDSAPQLTRAWHEFHET